MLEDKQSKYIHEFAKRTEYKWRRTFFFTYEMCLYRKEAGGVLSIIFPKRAGGSVREYGLENRITTGREYSDCV